MADEMTPSQEAAAMHGIAENLHYVPGERLACALKALEFYAAEYERQSTALEALGKERNTWARQLADAHDDRARWEQGYDDERRERVKATTKHDNMQIRCQMLAEEWRAIYERWKGVSEFPRVKIFDNHARALLKIVGDDD